MRAPLLTLITATGTVPEAQLLARLAALGAFPAEARARVAVQLRDPELSGKALYALGLRLREATAGLGVGLVVNDRLDVARVLGADGVHLGRRSVGVADARAIVGEGAWISVACHDAEDAARAAEEGADAAVLAPIFATPGKGAPLGVVALREARRRLPARCALVAMGGVDAASAPACLAAGADGVAAIRADPGALLQALLDARDPAC